MKSKCSENIRRGIVATLVFGLSATFVFFGPSLSTASASPLASTHLALSTNNAMIGSSLVITATVTTDSGTPISDGSGGVKFSFGSMVLCDETSTPVVGGVATCSRLNNFLAADTLTATYVDTSGSYAGSSGIIQTYIPKIHLNTSTIYYSHANPISADLENPTTHAVYTSAQGNIDLYSSLISGPVATCNVVNGVMNSGCSIPASGPAILNLTFNANFPAISVATDFDGFIAPTITQQPVPATNGDRVFTQAPIIQTASNPAYNFEDGALSCSAMALPPYQPNPASTAPPLLLSGVTTVSNIGSSFTFSQMGISGSVTGVKLLFKCNLSDAIAISNPFDVSATLDSSTTLVRTNTVTVVQSQLVDRTKKLQVISFSNIDSLTTSSIGETISATSDSGLPVSINAYGECTIAGNFLTPTGKPGVCLILASQNGDDTHSPAQTLVRYFQVLSDAVSTAPSVSTPATSSETVTSQSVTSKGVTSATAPSPSSDTETAIPSTLK